MKKSQKILATAIILIIAVVSFFLIGDRFLPELIRKKLEEKPVAAFRVKLETVEVSLLRNQVTLKQVMAEDTSGHGQISVSEITLRGLKIWPLLVRNEIVLRLVELDTPVVEMVLDKDSSSQAVTPADQNMQAFRLQHLKVKDARIRLLRKEGQHKDTVFSTLLDIDLWSLGTKSPQERYAYDPISFSRIRFQLHKGRYLLPEGWHAFEYDQAIFDSEAASLEVDEVRLKSVYGKYELGQKRGVEADWIDMTTKNLSLSAIRLNALLNDTAMVFGKARIAEFHIKAFRDKRLPFPNKPDTKLLRAMLKTLPVGFHSDSVVIEQGTISYAERVENSVAEGEVTFTQVQAQLLCLSNVDSLIDRETSMHARAMVMGHGVLVADFVFPNEKFPEAYRASGTLGGMDLTVFNPMLKQNAGVEVEKGSLKRLAFNFTYNNEQSAGDLLLEYTGLNVHLLNREDQTERKIKSFLTNAFVIQKENIRGERSFREGTIAFERDKKKSLFNYWWKSVLSGVKQVVIL